MEQYSAYISKINDLKNDIYKSLEFINWTNHVKKDSTVFVKPNFTYPTYKKGITTSPILLKCFLEILKDKADNVILGESDGGNHSFKAETAFKNHNMPKICKEAGVDLVSLSRLPSRKVEGHIQGKDVWVELPKLLLDEVDCFISVPVLKVHAMTNVTLSMKNLWGCYPDTMRGLRHKHLSQKLTLITKVLDPKIILLDGTYALDGHGPMYGTPKKTDLIMSSDNPVVMDSLGSFIMGMPLEKVDHILVAAKEGLGSTNLDKVYTNDDYTKFKMKFNVNKTFIEKVSVLLFNNETLAKLVFASPFTPIVYKFAGLMRNSDEKNVNEELNPYNFKN